MSRCREFRLRCKGTQPRKDPSHVSRHDQGILAEKENTSTEEAGRNNGSSRMELERSGVTFRNMDRFGREKLGWCSQSGPSLYTTARTT
jgi:hypothetical protein